MSKKLLIEAARTKAGLARVRRKHVIAIVSSDRRLRIAGLARVAAKTFGTSSSRQFVGRVNRRGSEESRHSGKSLAGIAPRQTETSSLEGRTRTLNGRTSGDPRDPG